MNNSKYNSIIYFPFKHRYAGTVKGRYIEIPHEGGKITGMIMEMEHRSFIVDITSPYWNASKGFVINPFPVHNVVFSRELDATNILMAQSLLIDLYLDCKHAYENADPAFWENKDYSRFYLRESVPYEEQSELDRNYGPQIAPEDYELYLESLKHINWPKRIYSYRREELSFITQQEAENARKFPGSRFEGNLVEIEVEGQKVQGEILKRDNDAIEIKIRYPYDGLTEVIKNRHDTFPPHHNRFKGLQYSAGALHAKEALQSIYLKAREMDTHFALLQTAYQDYLKLLQEHREAPERLAAEQELLQVRSQLQEKRNELRDGICDIAEYGRQCQPLRAKRHKLSKLVKIDTKALYHVAFQEIHDLRYFRTPHKYIFDALKNPNIIKGEYNYAKYPTWFR